MTTEELKKQQEGLSIGYQESEAVKQAQSSLQQQLAQKPGAYVSSWQTQLNDTLDQILSRPDFKFDLNGEALWDTYKDQYVTQGKLAMMDTMGQAQAMTGGYGNSYAQQAGQQAYQGYLQGLNDKIPELYQLALSRYQMEGDALNDRLALLQQQENQDYGRYQDNLSAWLTERDYLQSRYDAERDYDYGRYADDRDFAYNQYVADRNYQFQQEQAALEQQRWQTEYDLALRQYEDSLAAAQSATASRSSGGGSGGSYDTHGLSTSEIKALQKELGVTADGIWGPKTEAAYQAKYGSGNSDSNITVNMQSVNDLGYGAISEETLNKLVESGQVEEYVKNGQYYFKRTDDKKTSSSIPYLTALSFK